MKDFYKILEVHLEASIEDIKYSYRKLAQKYHPDKNNNNKVFEEKLKEINEAYSILGDTNTKAVYDANYKKFYSQSENFYQRQNRDFKETSSEKSEKENNQTNFQNNKMNSDTNNFTKKIFSKPVIFISILVFIGLILLSYNLKSITTYYDEKEKKEKYDAMIDSIQYTRGYSKQTIPSLKITDIEFETRWRNGKMYYKFSFSGNSSKNYDSKNIDTALQTLLNDASKVDFEQKMNNLASFEINFMDKDGFKIYAMKIDKNQMTRIVDNNGKTFGYSINTNVDLPPETYKDFNDWELTYTER